MKILQLFAILMLGVLTFTACRPEKVEKPFKIEGQLIEAGTGKPLSGVGVMLTESSQSFFGSDKNYGISEYILSDSTGFYSIDTKTQASGKLSILLYADILRTFENTSLSTGCLYMPEVELDPGEDYVYDFVLINQTYVEFNYDSLKGLEIDSLVFNISNNNLLRKFGDNGDTEICNFCYPNNSFDFGTSASGKYCFEETPELLQKSYSGAEAINSFYELYANTTVLSNFENTIGIKAYNNGVEVYNKSVTYNFKSDETSKNIKF